jgi:photosystem I subunit 10
VPALERAGLTAVDVLALGAFGHAIGVGIVLGLKGTGNL